MNGNAPSEENATGQVFEDEQKLIEEQESREAFPYRVAEYQRNRALEELPHQEGWNRSISADDYSALEQLLASNPDEAAMQKFLENRGVFLMRMFSGNNSRRVTSKPPLGSQFVPDFLMVDEDSMGMHWYGVELESPRAKAERKDGLQTAALTHAIGQIRDWRRWIGGNLAYARQSKAQNGLGLIGIDAQLYGLILIGRRSEYSEKFNDMRMQMLRNERIRIHSYDWLLDRVRNDKDGGPTISPVFSK